jgi:hypothetical protein
MSNDSENHSSNIEETESDEEFTDSWIRQSRDNDELNDDILDLIDVNREDSNLDHDGLIHALIEHAQDKINSDNE